MTKCKVTKYKLKKNTNLATCCTFLGSLVGIFLESGLSSKKLLELTYAVNQLWFWKYSPIFLLLHWPNLGPVLPFSGLWGLFLGLRSGSNTFLEPTYVVNQLWFRKYSPIFLLLHQPNLVSFLPFLGPFSGLGSGSKTFL